MISPDSIRQIINRGYDQFTGYGPAPIPGLQDVMDRVNERQSQELGRVAAGGTAQQGVVESGRQNILGGYARIANAAGANTERSVRDVAGSIDRGIGMFGQTPQTIGDPAATPQYPELAPAIDRLQRRTASGLRSQGKAIVGNANRQMDDVNAEYDDYSSRVKGWQKDKENEALMHYQLQRMALLREMAGAKLEKRQQLAGIWEAIAGDLTGKLNNINVAATKIASTGGA